MNNKENAIEEIERFIDSDEKGLLLTGAHQYELKALKLRRGLSCYYVG